MMNMIPIIGEFPDIDQAQKEYPFCDLASCQRLLEIMRLFLEHGANPNSHGMRQRTPLHEAVDFNPDRSPAEVEKAVKMLLRYGADVNARDRFGVTPLALVCQRKPPQGLSVSCCFSMGQIHLAVTCRISRISETRSSGYATRCRNQLVGNFEFATW
jgi:hypothetical protein